MATTGSENNRAASVLIVDDHPLIREGIADRLANVAELKVVGQAESCATAIAEVERLSPNIVLLDEHLPDGDALTLARRLARSHPAIQVVLHATSNLSSGQLDYSRAAAVVLKQLIGDNLVETLNDLTAAAATS